MSDYISRDAAKQILSRLLVKDVAECACNLVDCVLPADVEPVRYAEWKLIGADKLGRGGIWECTGLYGCGKSFPLKCDYCPNCGAKMDLEDKTDDGTAT